jgi:hypothetical protein
MIIGCDFHPSFQQIAYVEQETGEYEERRLSHRGEAEAFYRSLAGRAVRIGMEATGNRGIYLTPLNATGCGLTRVANGAGSVCTACCARR